MSIRYKYPSNFSKYTIRFLIAYSIIQPAVMRLIFNFDGLGRMYIILSVLSILTIFQTRLFRKVFFQKPNVIWGIWGVYVTLTTMMFGNPLDELPIGIFIFSRIFFTYILLCLVCFDASVNPKSCIRFLIICFVIYVLIGWLFQSNETTTAGRGGIEMGNQLPLCAVSMVGLASIAYVKKWINGYCLIVCVMLAFIVIFVAATRKALIGTFMLLAFMYFAKYKITETRNFLLMLGLIAVAFYAVTYIMDNTLIGERMESIETQKHTYNIGDSLFLKLVGDRSSFYIVGTKLFLENNIFTGIGLMHFMEKAKFDLPIHSEYIVQLCECGIIGCVITLIFYISIIKKILRIGIDKTNTGIKMIFLGYMLYLAFVSLTTWIYDSRNDFIVLGFIVGYCNHFNHFRSIKLKEIIQ